MTAETGASLAPKDALKAIRRFKPTSKGSVAVFDLDDTLIRGDLDQAFVRLATSRRFFPERNRSRVLAALNAGDSPLGTRGAKASINDLLREARDEFDAGNLHFAAFFAAYAEAFAGCTTADVAALARELFEGGYKDRIRGAAAGPHPVDFVDAVKERGLVPWIITLGHEDVARVAASYVGVAPENVIGWRLETRDGKYTGRVLRTPSVAGKDALIRELIKVAPSFSFGDSATFDGPMFRATTVAAFAVNPRPGTMARLQDSKIRAIELGFHCVMGDRAGAGPLLGAAVCTAGASSRSWR